MLARTDRLDRRDANARGLDRVTGSATADAVEENVECPRQQARLRCWHAWRRARVALHRVCAMSSRPGEPYTHKSCRSPSRRTRTAARSSLRAGHERAAASSSRRTRPATSSARRRARTQRRSSSPRRSPAPSPADCSSANCRDRAAERPCPTVSRRTTCSPRRPHPPAPRVPAGSSATPRAADGPPSPGPCPCSR